MWRGWTSEPGREALFPAPLIQPLAAFAKGKATRERPAARRRMAAQLASAGPVTQSRLASWGW
eukprot:11133990-Lingulodinium_polyedra.AAC.1